ncbi:MAG: hypothetical protein M0Z36_14685 [Thermaerobacter sp.]|nr:hypothetical protein [Thermaerobacter sp.]
MRSGEGVSVYIAKKADMLLVAEGIDIIEATPYESVRDPLGRPADNIPRRPATVGEC